MDDRYAPVETAAAEMYAKGAASERRPPEIPMEVEYLNKQVSMLRDVVDQLVDRLSPVLAPVENGPSERMVDQANETTTRIGGTLFEVRAEVDRIKATVYSALHRLGV
jgi:hypothetical protein